MVDREFRDGSGVQGATLPGVAPLFTPGLGDRATPPQVAPWHGLPPHGKLLLSTRKACAVQDERALVGGEAVARDGEADWSSPVLAGERGGGRLVFGKQRGGDQSLTDRAGLGDADRREGRTHVGGGNPPEQDEGLLHSVVHVDERGRTEDADARIGRGGAQRA